MKKAIYYTMDGMLAGLLIVGITILLLQSSYYEPNIDQKSFITQDFLNTLSEIKISEINNTFIQQEIQSGNITNTNKSALEQIGEYWALGENSKAQTLLQLLVNFNQTETKIRVSMEDEELLLTGTGESKNIVSTSRMVAGIAKGEPIAGFSSSAYLKKIRNKRDTKFAYLGGFIGQGNVTINLELPADYDSSRFVKTELILETPGTFELYINNNKCGSTYTGTSNLVKNWDISPCNSSFTNNENNISFIFTSTLNISYISGGLVKTEITTDTLQTDETAGYKRYKFPEIDGFVNIYDAISAQGLIRNWSLNMTFFSQYDTFLTLGNETIFIAPGSNQTQTIIYQKNNETLSPTQLPLRFGITNFSNITIYQGGTPTDSFLVTDVSGSMDDCAEYLDAEETYCGYEYKFWWWWFSTECPYTGSCISNECGVGTDTRNHLIYNKTTSTCNRTRIEVAKDADKLFVDLILSNSTQNKIGLVDFSQDANPYTALTNVQGTLDSEINTYSASGGTCTCCGINRARTLINNSENNKFIILLSDGEPTYKCSSFTDYTGGSGTTLENIQWAIDAGQEACSQNITVYTIGFGDSMSASGHDTMKQIACNDSLYFNATDASTLAQIYQNISQQILIAANYSSQIVNVIGEFQQTHLLQDSYIDLYYDPIIIEDLQGKISLNFESEQFQDCTYVEEIPSSVLIQDAYITSFSSSHWTKEVVVNDVTIYNLTNYGSDYALLGDPFTIQIPTAILNTGANNTIKLTIGDSPNNSSNCSDNNTMIYTALLNSSTTRSEAYEFDEGCTWNIESENNIITTTRIPSDYTGAKNCSYTESLISFNTLDAYDQAAHSLLKMLDPDENGKIITDLESSDLEITLTTISNVPYLWGPSLIKVEAHQ